jgi:hypothetical protein
MSYITKIEVQACPVSTDSFSTVSVSAVHHGLKKNVKEINGS